MHINIILLVSGCLSVIFYFSIISRVEKIISRSGSDLVSYSLPEVITAAISAIIGVVVMFFLFYLCS